MISSLMDTWILMSAVEIERRRRRSLYVLKSRGMPHSDEMRDFRIHRPGPRAPAGRDRRPRRDVAWRTTRLFELRLYIAGETPKALRAFENLRKICDEHLAGRYRIEVIDLLKDPQLGRGDQILALPTLVRRLPTPIKKIIGDLSNTERVLVGLDLRERQKASK